MRRAYMAGRLLPTFFILFLLSVRCFAAAPVFTPERVPVMASSWPETSGDTFRFVILGDKTSGGEGKWPIFDKAVDRINAIAPDFVITVGDQIPGHMEERAPWDAEWREWREHARRLTAPLIFIPGNHDIANRACYDYWCQDFGASYFSFLYRKALFLVLNTEEERFDGRGPRWEAMMTFARKALEENPSVDHTFLFFHKAMWADPRFQEDWRRLEKMLDGRRYTAVAGHEHYLSAERRDGRLLLIQNATGAGMDESDVLPYGCFHGFTQVTVGKEKADVAVITPDGAVYPPDIAPASFRKQITFDIVHLDAEMPEFLENGAIHTHGLAKLQNPFDTSIQLRLRIEPISLSGWRAQSSMQEAGWRQEKDSLIWEKALSPHEKMQIPLAFEAAPDRLPFPPALSQEVGYDGSWLRKEVMRMEEIPVMPIYPEAAWREVEEWRLIGPFEIGPIDPKGIGADIHSTNPGLFRLFGPESGYQKDVPGYAGLSWKKVNSGPKGLLNHNALLGTADEAAAFSYFAIDSPEAETTYALMYADNFVQAYVNGELVEKAMGFGAPGGFVYVPLVLHKGKNAVVIKTINHHGDWFLRFRLADPEHHLRLSIDPAAP